MAMQTRRFLVATAAVGWGLGTAGGTLVGMEAASAAPSRPAIDEIVVTARQRQETLQEAPVTVTALSSDDITRMALTDLEQIGQQVPNLRISYGGSGGAASVYLRGIGTGPDSAGFSSAVGLLVDDIHFERGRWIQQAYFDLEQVEVLKGPQSLYFGKNNPAGLVILRTRDPGDTFEANIRAGYETNADEYLVEGGVSIPINEDFAIRLAGRFLEQDGWMRNTAQAQPASADPLGFEIPGGGGIGKIPERRDRTGRLTAVWTPFDGFTANLKGEISRNRTQGNTQLLQCFGADGGPMTLFGVPTPGDDCNKNFKADFPVPPQELLDSEPREINRRVAQEWASEVVNLRLNYEVGAFSLTSVTGYQQYDVDHLQTTANGGGQVPFYEETDYDNFSQEFRVQSRFDGPVNFLAGALYTDSNLSFRNAARIAPLPPDSATGRLWSWDKTAKEDGESYSFYGEVIWDVSPTVELSGGVRYTREKRDFDFTAPFVHEILLGLGALSDAPLAGTFKDSNWSPQLTLAWRPNDSLTLFAAYREGFKSGGFDASFLLDPTAEIDDLRFESEEAAGYEFGLRSRLFDGQLQLNATAYFFTFDDMQVTALDAETTTFTIQNAAEASTDGVELDFIWLTPVDGLQLRGAVNYNLAEYDEFESACYVGQSVEAGCDGNFNPATGRFTTQDLSGQRLSVAPKWVANLGVMQDLHNLMDSGWSASLSLDGRYSSNYNSAIRNMPDAVQGSFFVWDASVRLFSPSEQFELAFIGRNLGNRAIDVFRSERALTDGSGGQGLPEGSPQLQRTDSFGRIERGRQLWLQASYRF